MIRSLIYAAAKGAERDGDLTWGRQLRAAARRVPPRDRYQYPEGWQRQ